MKFKLITLATLSLSTSLAMELEGSPRSLDGAFSNAPEAQLEKLITQLDITIRKRFEEWSRLASEIEFVQNPDSEEDDPDWYIADLEEQFWEPGEDFQAVDLHLVLENELDKQTVGNLQELPPILDNVDVAHLNIVKRKTCVLERDTKELTAKLMRKAKREPSEIKRAFEDNFKSTGLDPKRALEEIGLRAYQCQDMKLEEIQERWKSKFGGAEEESKELFLGRQIWYTIKSKHQLKLYLQYVNDNYQEKQEDSLDLQTALASAFNFGANLRILNQELETRTKSPRKQSNLSSNGNSRFTFTGILSKLLK